MRLFYSYSHVDEPLRDKLDRHLAALKRSGVISDWHDRKILAGENFDTRINQHLEDADIILFLISDDFLASSYIWDVEVKRAMEREQSGQCRVVPVVLRPVDLGGVPFENLARLPNADSGDVNGPFRRDVNIVGAQRRWYLHDAGEYSRQSRIL